MPKAFTHDDGKLTGVTFEKVAPQRDAKGRRQLVPTGEPDVHFPCDDVLVAIGQENAFPWIERDLGIEFDEWGMPVVDKVTMASTRPGVFFGGDAAFGPKNIIWAVAHGHDAAISIDKLLPRRGPDASARRRTSTSCRRRWASTSGATTTRSRRDKRYRVPLKDTVIALANIKVEVELGFDPKLAFAEAQRCLNCDVQTVFTDKLCIECDACVDICPMDCITFTANGEEAELRHAAAGAGASTSRRTSTCRARSRPAASWSKDEDVCLHCGLCAERCPTGAWDMQKFLLETRAGRRSLPRAARRREPRRRAGRGLSMRT